MLENQKLLRSISFLSREVRSPFRERYDGRTTRGSDQEKLLRLVSFLEEVLFVRWQKLDDDTAHNDERIAMKAIADNLLAIKICKLGWPDPFS
jgi:hypothetical protein